MRLGLIPTVAPYVLPAVLAGLSEQLPDLNLRVIEDQTERLLTGLREGAVDAAVMALPAEVPGLSEIPIYEEDFVLALPPGHALAGKRRVPPTALADLPLLLLDEGHCLRDQTLRSAVTREFVPSWPPPAPHRWPPRSSASMVGWG